MGNKVGQISLMATIGGLALTESAIHLGFLHGPISQIIASGFEAGTVGGLADWFAVSALFREIPIPIIGRHTNIIVKNRAKLTEGAVDLVTNQWLAPDVIKEKLSNIQLAETILHVLQEPKNQDRAIELIRDILYRFAESIDQPEVATLLERILKDQIQGINLSKPLGLWLQEAIRKGEHNQVWEMILESAKRTIDDASTHQLILRKVKEAIKEYKERGLLKNIFLNLAEFLDVLDEHIIKEKIIDKLNDFIREAKANPLHPTRLRLDDSLMKFACGLYEGDPSSQEIIDNLIV